MTRPIQTSWMSIVNRSDAAGVHYLPAFKGKPVVFPNVQIESYDPSNYTSGKIEQAESCICFNPVILDICTRCDVAVKCWKSHRSWSPMLRDKVCLAEATAFTCPFVFSDPYAQRICSLVFDGSTCIPCTEFQDGWWFQLYTPCSPGGLFLWTIDSARKSNTSRWPLY